jgi:aryl-alcohol dehydrogenase-like predicted oxidoreductase
VADIAIHGKVAAECLQGLVKSGLADMAGASVYHPEEVDLLLENDVYQAVQLPMNVLDQRFIGPRFIDSSGEGSGMIARLSRRGIRIFVRSVFFQGLLFLEPDSITDPDLIRYALPHLKTLRQLSEQEGMSIAQIAVAFLRNIPGITSLVLGADNPEQVKRNARLFDSSSVGHSLSKEADLRCLIQETFKDVDYRGIMAVLSRPKDFYTP